MIIHVNNESSGKARKFRVCEGVNSHGDWRAVVWDRSRQWGPAAATTPLVKKSWGDLPHRDDPDKRHTDNNLSE